MNNNNMDDVQSLQLNNAMMNKAKNNYYDTGDDSFLDNMSLGLSVFILLFIHVVNLIFVGWAQGPNDYEMLTGHPSPFRFSEFVLPLCLVLCGICNLSTGAAYKRKPIFGLAIFDRVCRLIAVYTRHRFNFMLTPASANVAWFIPVLIMEKDYQQAKMQEANEHV